MKTNETLKVEIHQTTRYGDCVTGIRTPSGSLKIPNVIGHLARVTTHCHTGAQMIQAAFTVVKHEGITAYYTPGRKGKAQPLNLSNLPDGTWFVPFSPETKWGFVQGTENAVSITNLEVPA
jgi:hypothetical protein